MTPLKRAARSARDFLSRKLTPDALKIAQFVLLAIGAAGIIITIAGGILVSVMIVYRVATGGFAWLHLHECWRSGAQR